MKPGLLGGLDLRDCGRAVPAADRERLELLVLDERHRHKQRREQEIGAARHDFSRRLLRALERHMDSFEARAEAEALGVEMGGVAGAGRGVVYGSGLGFGSTHQIVNGLVALLRLHHENGRYVAEGNDRAEIAGGVEWQAGVDCRLASSYVLRN